jgi:integrase
LRKEHLEAEEYITLLKAPCTNEEVREAFILSCYTGMRWCDVKALNWQQVKENRMAGYCTNPFGGFSKRWDFYLTFYLAVV